MGEAERLEEQCIARKVCVHGLPVVELHRLSVAVSSEYEVGSDKGGCVNAATTVRTALYRCALRRHAGEDCIERA